MPYLFVNFLLMRVSSHKIKSTQERILRDRRVISPKLPIGVATMYNPF